MRQALLLFVSILFGGLIAAAQTGSNIPTGNSAQTTNPPVNRSDVVTTPPTNWPIVVTTPEVALPTTAPSPVGASNATAANQAGASAATLNQNSTGSTSATTPQLPGNYPSGSGALVDVGLASFDSAWTTGQSDESLAQAAAQAKTMLARGRPRVYTNDDIARLRQQEGLPAGNQGTAANSNTMPASDVVNSDANQAPAAKPAPAPDQTPQNQPPVPQKPNPFQPHGS